jgi:mutator protein MutT
MEITINENNLTISDIEEINTKVRAIIINDQNKILVANYGNVLLLPGGKVDAGETYLNAIIRELREELGYEYKEEDLNYFKTITYYQKNYPKRDGTFQNRLVQTHYFITKYKEVLKDEQQLTENEKNSNFHLELISLEELENIIINNENTNPRNIYFQKELLTIIRHYKKENEEVKIKKLELKQ